MVVMLVVHKLFFVITLWAGIGQTFSIYDFDYIIQLNQDAPLLVNKLFHLPLLSSQKTEILIYM